MAKRRKPSPGRTAHLDRERERKQKRLVIGCGAVVVLALVGLVAVQLLPPWWGLFDGHPHVTGAHGGSVVAAGKGQSHYHAEFVIEPTGAVQLYTLGQDIKEAVPVESQHLLTEVQAEGDSEPSSMILSPAPESGKDGEATSRFFGKLPGEFVGRTLTLRIPQIRIGGERLSFEMKWVSKVPHDDAVAGYLREQEQIYLSPGGRYTEADIAATGRQTAFTRFRGRRPAHDLHVRVGDHLCPVTRIKASRDVTWVVDGKTYQFCCAPCIDTFIARAKEQPDQIKPPEEYIKGE